MSLKSFWRNLNLVSIVLKIATCDRKLHNDDHCLNNKFIVSTTAYHQFVSSNVQNTPNECQKTDHHNFTLKVFLKTKCALYFAFRLHFRYVRLPRNQHQLAGEQFLNDQNQMFLAFCRVPYQNLTDFWVFRSVRISFKYL